MDYKTLYADFLKKHLHAVRPLTVVFDASNGTAGMIIKKLVEGSNINAIIIHDDIDPDFKAHGPNPLLEGATDDCAKAIKENNADIGVVYDADADRAFFLDDQGRMIPACFIANLLFSHFAPQYTVDELVFQSLRMLKTIPETDLIPSKIGAYHLKEKLRNHGATAGAEYSGHYYFKDFFNVDSGIFATVMMLNVISKMDQKLSVWKDSFGEFHSTAKEIVIDGKDLGDIYKKLEDKYAQVSKIDRLDGLTFVFDKYWVNVRSSNTEPILRIIAEGTIPVSEIVEETGKLIN